MYKHKHNMIKSFIITVILVTGCLCRTIPDDLPVSDNPDEQASISTDASKADTTQELSTEVSVGDKEVIANSESPEQSAESKSVNTETTESKDVQVRSAEDTGAGNSENNEESVAKTSLDDVMSISSENPDVSTTAEANDSKGDEVTRTSRNSESNSSAELKSASVETETGDDAAHIHVKEQAKQAPSEEDVSNEKSGSEENSTTSSVENDSKSEPVGESKNADEESQVRTGSPEESSSDPDQDSTKSAETQGPVGLIKNAADALIGPPVNRRMLSDIPTQQHDVIEKHSSEAEDTKTAPQEETTPSGHQVHSNYLGGSRFGYSQYPYSPLEDTATPKQPSTKETPADPIMSSGITFIKQRSGYPDTPFQNPGEKHQTEHLMPRLLPPLPPLKPLLPHPQQHLSDVYRPLPSLSPPQTFEPYKPQPVQPMQPWLKPLPLPAAGQFFPIPQQLEQVPLFKPDCVRSACNNQPIQHWQPQHTFPKLLTPWPARSAMKTMQPFNPLNSNSNMFSMYRQAVPEVLPLSDTFSGTWNTFQATPFAVSSSVRSHSSGFSSF